MKKSVFAVTCAVAVTVALMLCAGCSGKAESPASSAGGDVKVVYTTFYPTRYFAERIGGDAISVVCPLPDGADPIFWMPEAGVIGEYQKADLVIINGASFEKWVEKVSLPSSKIVDTAQPLKDGFVKFKNAVTHTHGPAGAHSHEGIDGHTWVDPLNAKVQAEQIKAALVKLVPESAEAMEANFKALAADLDALDEAFRALAKKDSGRVILASHPAYNYLAKRYGFKIFSLDLDPEGMPSDVSMAQIKKLVAEKKVRHILWEATPLKEISDALAKETGLTSVTFSPCELPDRAEIADGLDYLKVMRENIRNFKPLFE